jgi:hypothetical protein
MLQKAENTALFVAAACEVSEAPLLSGRQMNFR